MTHFRTLLRFLALHGVGSLSQISPGVHVLAGHYMGRSEVKNQEVFLHLLAQLKKTARLINIETACDLIRKGQEVDEPLIAFTFDDGFSECHSHIAPALEQHGVNAAFFVNPGFCAGSINYIKEFAETVVKIPGKQPMRASQIRDLADRGFIIGAHTIDHVDLTSTDDEFLKYQIVDCKQQVEDISNKPCDWFAWTFGGYKHISPRALEIAVENYSIVFSSDQYEYYTAGKDAILNRRHFEPDWPASHVKFFLRHKRYFKED